MGRLPAMAASLRPVSISVIRQLSDYDYVSACVTILAKERRLDLVRLVRPLACLTRGIPPQTPLDRLAWIQSYLLDNHCEDLWSRLISFASECDPMSDMDNEALGLGAKIHMQL